MSGRRNLARVTGLILVAIAISGGCEESDVLAPKDSTMTLTAYPNSLDFPEGTTELSVTLTAQVLASGGFPQQGVAVRFTSTAGDLDSGGEAIKTDWNSVAQDVLTVYPEDPTTIDVTATSGTLSKTVTISKSGGGVVPTDGAITASADPASIVIDGAAGRTSGTSEITAVLKTKAGAAVPLARVDFTPSAKVDPSFDRTDTAGAATTTLTVEITDPVSVDVTAQASTLSDTVTVTKSVSSAPPGTVIQPGANPTNIIIGVGQTSGTSQISATVRTSLAGDPIPGITVTFTTSAGTLSAQNATTGNDGKATTTLTLRTTDVGGATVTMKVVPESISTFTVVGLAAP